MPEISTEGDVTNSVQGGYAIEKTAVIDAARDKRAQSLESLASNTASDSPELDKLENSLMGESIPSYFSQTEKDYNLEGMLLSVSELSVLKAPTTPTVGKLPKHLFFQIMDDVSWHGRTAALVPFTFGFNEEWFFVHPHMRSLLEGEWIKKLLIPCIGRDGAIYLWPVSTPDKNGNVNSWPKSAIDIAKHCRGKWIRIQSDQSAGGYVAFEAQGELPAPEWPFKNFGDLLNAAFKDKVIDSEDHIVVKKLRGLI